MHNCWNHSACFCIYTFSHLKMFLSVKVLFGSFIHYPQDEEFERSERQRIRSTVENVARVSSQTQQTSSSSSLHIRKAHSQKTLHPDP